MRIRGLNFNWIFRPTKEAIEIKFFLFCHITVFSLYKSKKISSFFIIKI